MIYGLLALLSLNAGYLVLLDRKDKRHLAQVQTLCQRIQAPDQAVIEHSETKTFDGPLYSNEFSEEEDRLEAMLRDGE